MKRFSVSNITQSKMLNKQVGYAMYMHQLFTFSLSLSLFTMLIKFKIIKHYGMVVVWASLVVTRHTLFMWMDSKLKLWLLSLKKQKKKIMVVNLLISNCLYNMYIYIYIYSWLVCKKLHTHNVIQFFKYIYIYIGLNIYIYWRIYIYSPIMTPHV